MKERKLKGKRRGGLQARGDERAICFEEGERSYFNDRFVLCETETGQGDHRVKMGAGHLHYRPVV